MLDVRDEEPVSWLKRKRTLQEAETAQWRCGILKLPNVFLKPHTGLWECGSLKREGTELSKGSSLRTFYPSRKLGIIFYTWQTNIKTCFSLKSTRKGLFVCLFFNPLQWIWRFFLEVKVFYLNFLSQKVVLDLKGDWIVFSQCLLFLLSRVIKWINYVWLSKPIKVKI